VEAPEPCHLIEAELVGVDDFDWGEVTQEDSTQPQANWQVAYDEQPLDERRCRWVFFFHYLDFDKPLLTPEGPIDVPAPTPRPEHLWAVEYFEP